MPDRRWLLLALCTFALSSCSSDQWVHRHKEEGEFLHDYNQCEKQVALRSNVQMVTLTGYQQYFQLEQCLHKEGWRKVKR